MLTLIHSLLHLKSKNWSCGHVFKAPRETTQFARISKFLKISFVFKYIQKKISIYHNIVINNWICLVFVPKRLFFHEYDCTR